MMSLQLRITNFVKTCTVAIVVDAILTSYDFFLPLISSMNIAMVMSLSVSPLALYVMRVTSTYIKSTKSAPVYV